MSLPRSHLYVPGNDVGRLDKSLDRGTDAIIVDLEDAIALDKKDEARALVKEWLPTVSTSVEIWVRINNTEGMKHLDVEAIKHPSVTGIVLAKTSSIKDVEWLDKKLTGTDIHISALIESAEGVFNAHAIAKGPRVTRLQIGEADLRSEIGTSTDEETTIQYARSVAVFASAAAQINPPVAAVSTNFRDLNEFRASTMLFKKWGYFGRTCIHPAQLEIANEIFTPTAEEMAAAQDIIDRLAAAGGGVGLDARGQMIDEGIAKVARRTLSFKKD
jgi:citrate lyase subunit beta/citryl-CoA lyase